MATGRRKIGLVLLRYAPLIVFVGVFGVFAVLSSTSLAPMDILRSKFLSRENLVNILIQSSSAAIVAMGMTFVLLTGGIDLSVGSIMFLSAAVAGKMLLAGQSVPVAFAVIVGIGLLYGAWNAFFITRFGILPFVVTLSTLFAGRGLSLMITQTRAMNLPGLVHIGATKVLGIVPFPILVFLVVLVVAHLVLTKTPFGRQIYAVGNDREAAKKAGIHTGCVLFLVYVVNGLCAAVGGLVLLSQLGAVSPTFGYQREFAAIAAAVLGGTSLFGGRGKVFPGTVLARFSFRRWRMGL